MNLDWLTHVLIGIVIGAYLFNGTIRAKANILLVRLFHGLMAMAGGKKAQPVKRTANGQRKATAQATPKANGNGHKITCPDCGQELIPAGGKFSGGNICLNCRKVVV
jgi:hypothetical protein